MEKKILAIIIALLMVGVVTGIATLFLFPSQPDQPPQVDDAGSTSEGIQEVVNANNKFAFDIYSKLDTAEQKNMFYSPYSLSAALAMTSEGAKGTTADEINSVFHLPEKSTLRPNFAAIYNQINQENNEYELRTGNALWVQQDHPFLEEYRSNVETYYGGKAANVDFIRETEKSRQTINNFIEEQTNNKIQELLPQGVLNANTKLVLTNAVYFKGTWEWEFDTSDTRDQEFKITPSNIVQTPMMYMKPDKATFNYADLGDVQLLELPYKGGDISMLILLPAENLDALESSLTAEKLSEYKTQMKEASLDSITLPKFEFDTKYSLADTLSALGMPTAFTPYDPMGSEVTADFSGMDGTRDLFISAVIHKAYINVDEKGTEAAAATGVVLRATSAMPSNVFRADHPFIFIIQEKKTGNILFMGRVTDPTQ